MSDIAPDAPPADAAPAPDTGGAAAGGGASATPSGVEIPGIEALPESWQKHIKELREENAKARTEHKPFKEAFDGWSEADRQVLLGLARNLRVDPKAGAEEMKRIAEALLTPEEAEKVADAVDGGQPLTAEQVQKMLDARDQARTVADQEQKIISEAETLGYKQNTREYRDLLYSALNEHNGDLKAAHEALEAEKLTNAQKIIDEYMAGKRGDAESLPTAGSGGAAPSNSSTPKTWAEARRSATERLSKL